MPDGYDDPVNIEGVAFEEFVEALLQVDPNALAEADTDESDDE